MIWKPKEKELTREEAIETAKRELAPFWFGITPQIAGVSNGQDCVVLPLDTNFQKVPWLILLVDATDFSGELAMYYAKEWQRRYRSLQLNLLMVLIPTYSFLKTPEPIQLLMSERQLGFPVTTDNEDTLAAAFGAVELPKIVLLDEGKSYFEYSGQNWQEQAELHIQRFLRSRDPGLPLLPIFIPQDSRRRDSGRLEFGFRPKMGTQAAFSVKEYVVGEQGLRVRQSLGVPRPPVTEPEVVFISGKWFQGPEILSTSDPTALLAFKSRGAKVSLIAQMQVSTSENALISVEVNGAPAYDNISGEDLMMDDTGDSSVKVLRPQLYHVLTGLPPDQREVTFRFPKADLAPVQLYGLRFAD